MALPSFNTVPGLLTQLAAVQKTTSAALPAFWTPLATTALQRATDRIYERLLNRGYTTAQIAAWDSGPDVELCIASVMALTDGGMLEASDPHLLERYDSYLDPEKGLLVTVILTVGGGQWQSPGDVPGTVQGGGPEHHGHWHRDEYGIRW